MLVELFGICSGDKRLYECSEAFHMQLLQVSSLTLEYLFIANFSTKTSARCQGFQESLLDPDSEGTWQK